MVKTGWIGSFAGGQPANVATHLIGGQLELLASNRDGAESPYRDCDNPDRSDGYVAGPDGQVDENGGSGLLG